MTKIDADLLAIQRVRDVTVEAKAAQKELEKFSQEQLDRIVRAMAEAAESEAENLAKMAVKETGFGVVEHKVIKNLFAARDVYESIKNTRTVGIVREDKQKGVMESVNPYGVIAAIIPSTNPTSTAIFKCLVAVKARNAIVISPHPSARECTIRAAEICANAAYAAGAPRGLIGWLEKPTLEATNALMTHRNVDLILATGGSGLVRAAYSSGKPAYGVGPGNVPAYIEETADISKAVKDIMDSKTFDNGTICASEQAVIVDNSIRSRVVDEFRAHHAYFLSPEEKTAVGEVVFPSPGKLNAEIVGKSATYIAKMAGISVPDHTRVLIGEEENFGKEFPFSLEKLSPLLGFYSVENWEDGCEVSLKLLEVGGRGHTLVIHSQDKAIIKEFFMKKPVSRILVNTPSSLGAIGATTGLRPSFTLGCGTYGGNITSDNVTLEHLMNVKRLAYETRSIEIPGSTTCLTPSKKELSMHEEVVQTVLEEIRPYSQKFTKEQISKIIADVLANVQINHMSGSRTIK